MEDDYMSKVRVKKDRDINRKDILNTTIDGYILNDFRKQCRRMGVPMNTILETFMRQFANEEFNLRFGRTNVKVDLMVDSTPEDNIFDV